MAIPDFESLIFPVLEIAKDGNQHSARKTVTRLANQFGLTHAERKQRQVNDSRKFVFERRVGWARYFLKRAGLLQNPSRGYFQITARGKTLLAQQPQKIDVKLLSQFPEFEEWHNGSKKPRARKNKTNDGELFWVTMAWVFRLPTVTEAT